jgi:hypothetical protein
MPEELMNLAGSILLIHCSFLLTTILPDEVEYVPARHGMQLVESAAPVDFDQYTILDVT